MKTDHGFLTIKNLSFSYQPKSKFVLRDFSCEIPLGSRIAILGLNGSGKSTFLNLLLGMLTPDSGSIKLQNSSTIQDLSSVNGAVGYLPQLENIPFDYLVHEYVMLGRLSHIPLFSVPNENDQDIVRKVLDSLKMADFYQKRLREISGGELQRVRLARILAQEPEIILMDEPATHLDIKNKRSLYKLINELSNEGKTLIYSSHDPLEISNTSDYCVLMSQTKETRLVATPDLKDLELLSEYFETELNM
ncbi:MAG: ABC transporter ATP-binding protein [Chloroflexi bacterium]|nr:ABC transporter ATP-binding protein [Chloroflexota bacterium]